MQRPPKSVSPVTFVRPTSAWWESPSTCKSPSRWVCLLRGRARAQAACVGGAQQVSVSPWGLPRSHQNHLGLPLPCMRLHCDSPACGQAGGPWARLNTRLDTWRTCRQAAPVAPVSVPLGQQNSLLGTAGAGGQVVWHLPHSPECSSPLGETQASSLMDPQWPGPGWPASERAHWGPGLHPLHPLSPALGLRLLRAHREAGRPGGQGCH